MLPEEVIWKNAFDFVEAKGEDAPEWCRRQAEAALNRRDGEWCVNWRRLEKATTELLKASPADTNHLN